MSRSVAIFLSLFVLSTAFCASALVLAIRLTPEDRRSREYRPLLGWFLKGLALPCVVWVLMNAGLSWNLQPFMPQIQAAQNAGKSWVLPFLRFTGYGVFIASSYWAALTLGWSLYRAHAAADAAGRPDFKSLCFTCALAMVVPAGIVVVLGGLPLLGMALCLILAPMSGYAPALLRPRKTPPMYARAIARMKLGKYSEAEVEIIRQLEKQEDDFEGWMMLAELYANQFLDIRGAEQTILDICDQPKVTPSQISVALHKLADWHLKLDRDPDAARRALQVICTRLPGTHLAHMAELRINQLPLTADELLEDNAHAPVPLPALGDTLDQDAAPAAALSPAKAAELANQCVERLRRDPNNIVAREKLARLFSEHLGRADQGIQQIQLLLDLPAQPDMKRAEWISWQAAWHLRYLQDQPQARKLLARLVQEFPKTPQALAARRRLQLLDQGGFDI